jgi:hypothetical protein
MNIAEEVASLRTRLENIPKEAIPTWNEFVEGLSEWLPIAAGEPFTFTSEEVSDPHAVFDGDNESWTTETYSVDFEFKENGTDDLVVIVNQGDVDGNWDVIAAGGEEEFEFIYRNFLSSRPYFICWAEYHLWCAENGGVDPLENYYRLEDSTVEAHLKSAKDMISYAERGI